MNEKIFTKRRLCKFVSMEDEKLARCTSTDQEIRIVRGDFTKSRRTCKFVSVEDEKIALANFQIRKSGDFKEKWKVGKFVSVAGSVRP